MKIKQHIYTAVVIGCGRIGASFEYDPGRPKPASHAAAFKHNKRTILLAVVDTDEKLARAAADYYRVPYYTDAEACLAEVRPDIVAIATPPSTHEALVKLAIKQGVKGIVCEKPLAQSDRSGAAIRAAVEKSRVALVVNHQRRFFPLFKKVQKDIAAGKFGRVQQVTCYYNNGLYNNGTHTVDALRFLLGSECVWAVGHENVVNSTAPVGDANIDGLLGFMNGTVATLQSFDGRTIGIHDFHLLCDTGEVVISKYGYHVEYRPVRTSAEFKGVREFSSSGRATEDVRSMVADAVDHVVTRIDGTGTTESSATDALATMRVLQALAQSARSKKIITL